MEWPINVYRIYAIGSVTTPTSKAGPGPEFRVAMKPQTLKGILEVKAPSSA